MLKMQKAWLIERRDRGLTEYWSMEFGCDYWVEDSNFAVKFADEESAKLVSEGLESSSEILVCEHGWYKNEPNTCPQERA